MNKRLTVACALVLLTTNSLTAQHYDITRQEADSLQAVLSSASSPVRRADLLLSLAQYHIFKPGENKPDLDSGSMYINEVITLNKTLRSAEIAGYLLVNESYLLREKGEKDQGKIKADKAVSTLKNANNRGYLGRALYEQSMYIGVGDSFQVMQKTRYVEDAVGAFRESGDKLRTARSLEVLGDLYMMREEREKSIQALQEALALYNSIGYQKLLDINKLLGVSYRAMNNYGLALHHHLMALRSAELTKDSSLQRSTILNQIGMIYTTIGQSEKAIEYTRQALAIAHRNKDTTRIAHITSNTADNYNDIRQPEVALQILQQFPANRLSPDFPVSTFGYYRGSLIAYLQLKQFDKARQCADKILALVESGTLPQYFQGGAYRNIANYWMQAHQPEKAKKYLDKSDELERAFCPACDPSRNMMIRYKIDSAQGNYRDAFYSLVRYKGKADSIFGEKNIRQLAVLGVEYEVARKQDSIQLMDKDIVNLKLANDLQHADLQQARFTSNIIIAGILIAIIIIVLLYRQYKHKQRSNSIISQKNEQLEHLVIEKEWLLKEIHHRVKNNFQTVMSLLGTQTAYLKNDVAVSAINDSQQRIQSMLLIHQRLYKSNHLSSVRIQEYIYELVESLNDSYDNRQVRFHLQIAPVEFDLAHSIPLGLILNEAITNAFKYAFPDNRPALISITLINPTDNIYQLTIHDNGIGLPPAFKNSQSDSMGINLMRGLVHEIGASIRLNSENGTRITIDFTYEPGTTMADHVAYAP